jgi:hypothetical protein
MSHRSSHTHCQAPQAQAQTKACQRVCLPQPEKNLKIFLPSLKKILKHSNASPTLTKKTEMKALTSLI